VYWLFFTISWIFALVSFFTALVYFGAIDKQKFKTIHAVLFSPVIAFYAVGLFLYWIDYTVKDGNKLGGLIVLAFLLISFLAGKLNSKRIHYALGIITVVLLSCFVLGFW